VWLPLSRSQDLADRSPRFPASKSDLGIIIARKYDREASEITRMESGKEENVT
jgi:hypothetical protein